MILTFPVADCRNIPFESLRGNIIVNFMMDWDILKKEQEYHRENELIESKTKALLMKVNDAMKMQENILKDSNAMSEVHRGKTIQQVKEVDNQNFPKIPLNDPSVPNEDVLNNMGQRGMHNFYRSKIKALKDENAKLQSEIKIMSSEIKQLQKNFTQCLEDKEKWFLQYNVVKSQNNKLEHQLSKINTKLQNKEAENSTMRKEIEILKKENKGVTQSINSNEAKLQKALEENEKNKSLLLSLRKSEKEMKENHRKQVQELTATIQQTEKHKKELIHGFKKQLQLIENLKKQKQHLETFNILQIAEAEYMKILDWRSEN